MSISGFLLIDKPTGPSSFSILKQIDRRFHLTRSKQKIGHGGTLDPEASGLLVAAIGRATRLLKFFLGSDKHYLADFCLGRSTTTDDATGETLEEAPWQHLTQTDVENALSAFRGTIQQVPPNFSALHVQGKRAYELAAQGKTVVLEPREITLYHTELTHCDLPQSPVISLSIACSGGTYIRSIARDLGQKLGTRAHMCALRRTQSCRFDIEQAHTLDDILAQDDLASLMIPAEQALAHFPAIALSPKAAFDLMHGYAVHFSAYAPATYRIQCGEDPKLLAVLELHPDHTHTITRIDT